MRNWAQVLLIGICLVLSTALANGHDASGQTAEGNLVESLRANPEFSTFVAALEQVEVIEMLEQEGPFTIFAPTNQAFEEAGFDISSMEPSELSALVHNHIVPGVVTSELLITLSEVETLLGRRLAVLPFEAEAAVAASPDAGDVAGGGEAAEATDEEDPETPPAEEPPQTEANDPEKTSDEPTIDTDREDGVETEVDEDPETPPAEPTMPEGGVGTEIGAATISHPLTETANGVFYGIDTLLGLDAGEGGVQESP